MTDAHESNLPDRPSESAPTDADEGLSAPGPLAPRSSDPGADDPSLEPPAGVDVPPSATPVTPTPPPKTVTVQAQWIALAVAALALGVLLWPKAEYQKAPMGEIETAAGEEVELESVVAPVTLLHFWSTWCLPCKTETPAIQRLGESLATRDGFDLVMVAVADDPNNVDEFIGDRDATFYDNHWRLAHKYDTRALPETHLIVDGVLAESFVGAMDWDSPAVRARIDAAIDEVSASDGASASNEVTAGS